MPTILVVEDELALRETLEYNLRRQDYTVESASDGHTAIREARRIKPDLILVDVMLPGLDGFEVCRILRQEMSVPILILTARDDEIDRVIGLEIGADDYVTKPFSMRELMARVKAHLRRERLHSERLNSKSQSVPEAASQPNPEPAQVMAFGNLLINLTRHEVLLNSQPVPLKPKEFDLLVYLAQRRGQAISRDAILQQVWGWEYFGGTRTVDVHIHWLREKIEANPTAPTRLVTVRGAGYRFEG